MEQLLGTSPLPNFHMICWKKSHPYYSLFTLSLDLTTYNIWKNCCQQIPAKCNVFHKPATCPWWQRGYNNTNFIKSLTCIQDTCSSLPKKLVLWIKSSLLRHQIAVLNFSCSSNDVSFPPLITTLIWWKEFQTSFPHFNFVEEFQVLCTQKHFQPFLFASALQWVLFPSIS